MYDEKSLGVRSAEGTPGESPAIADALGSSDGTGARALNAGGSTKKAAPAVDKRLKRPLSKRSGGPRTDSGIAVASKNSLTHGAYATRLPDFHDFYCYADGARSEFKPRGLIEETLVMSLAHEAYKSDRLQQLERSRMLRASQQVVDPQALAALLHFPWAQSHAELLLEPVNQPLLQRAIHGAWVELAAPSPSPPEPGQPVCMQDQRVLELYEQGCELLGSVGLVPYMHEGFFMRLDVVMHEAREPHGYLGRRIAQRSGEMVLVQYWLYRNAPRVTACVEQVLQGQVLEVMGDERLARASSHVSSKIYEGMSSLAMARSVKDEASDSVWRVPAVRPRPRGR